MVATHSSVAPCPFAGSGSSSGGCDMSFSRHALWSARRNRLTTRRERWGDFIDDYATSTYRIRIMYMYFLCSVWRKNNSRRRILAYGLARTPIFRTTGGCGKRIACRMRPGVVNCVCILLHTSAVLSGPALSRPEPSRSGPPLRRLEGAWFRRPASYD